MKNKNLINALIAFSMFLIVSTNSIYGMVNGDSTKFILSAAIGTGVPMANFGKADSLPSPNGKDNTHIAGYAKTGFHFNITAGYHITPTIGVQIQIGGNTNKFDIDSYAKLNGINPTEAVSVGSHYIGSYLIGPFFTFPLYNSKLNLDLKLLGGLMTAQFPEIMENETYLGKSYAMTETIKSISAFGYNIGAGLSYKIIQHFGVKIGVDYLGGNPTFTSVSGTSTVDGTTTFNTQSGQKLAMHSGIFNISAGLVLGF